jgi:hypothetical protein
MRLRWAVTCPKKGRGVHVRWQNENHMLIYLLHPLKTLKSKMNVGLESIAFIPLPG